MKRQYFEDIDYKPFLFYVIFGVSKDEIEVSKTKHHVEEFPHGLTMQFFGRDKDSEYIDGFLEGAMENVLKESNNELYNKCKQSNKCAIIRGPIDNDATFDYMRNVVGFIQAFIDQGAYGILDLLTISLISPVEWTERYFEKKINVQNHVVILISEDNGKYWMHTRGMAKFGRPDISIVNVREDKIEDSKQVIDQMIYYGGQGVFFQGNVKLHIQNGKSYVVNAEFIDDFDNEDFNNAYYKVVILEKA